MGKKQIESYKRTRQTWEINPKERVKEDKKEKDMCEECGIYKTDPGMCCFYCEDVTTTGNA